VEDEGEVGKYGNGVVVGEEGGEVFGLVDDGIVHLDGEDGKDGLGQHAQGHTLLHARAAPLAEDGEAGVGLLGVGAEEIGEVGPVVVDVLAQPGAPVQEGVTALRADPAASLDRHAAILAFG